METRESGKRPLARKSPVLKPIIIPLFFLVSFIPLSTQSQYNYRQYDYKVLAAIDDLVQEIDSLSLRSQKTFHLNKVDKGFNGVKETWHYTMRDGKVAVFQVRYVIDSTEFTEVYYIDKGTLIYSEEYETMYYQSTGDDEIKWGGIYYFVRSGLRQRTTLGDKKIRRHNWNPEMETLARFERRFLELKENMTMW